MNEVYVVQQIEYERGFGSKPDGYLAFMNEKSATEYIEADLKTRNPRNVPNSFVQNVPIGRKPCSSDFLIALIASMGRRLYVDRLEEMFWTQEQRSKKYTT